MAVIKATPASLADAAHMSAFKLEDLALLDQARRQSAEIVNRAQQEAAVIRAAAQTEVRIAAERAAQDARDGAEKRIRELADARIAKELQTLTPALQKALREVQQARDTWLAHWENAAVRLAGAIAARLIRRELAHAPEIPLELVRESLALAAGSPRLRLRLHPQDLQALGPQVQQLVAALAASATTEMLSDEKLTPGGCVLESDFGTIDQQFDAQLARVVEELAHS